MAVDYNFNQDNKTSYGYNVDEIGWLKYLLGLQNNQNDNAVKQRIGDQNFTLGTWQQQLQKILGEGQFQNNLDLADLNNATTRYGADAGLAGTKYSSDAQLAAAQAAADAQRYGYDQGLAGVRDTNQANLGVAGINAGAGMYGADREAQTNQLAALLGLQGTIAQTRPELQANQQKQDRFNALFGAISPLISGIGGMFGVDAGDIARGDSQTQALMGLRDSQLQEARNQEASQQQAYNTYQQQQAEQAARSAAGAKAVEALMKQQQQAAASVAPAAAPATNSPPAYATLPAIQMPVYKPPGQPAPAAPQRQAAPPGYMWRY